MTSTIVVQYQTRADAADENQRLVEEVFAELARADPGGLRYATFRLADGVSFVHIACRDGEANPLTNTAAFAEFQKGIGGRCVVAPQAVDATLVGSYRFLTE
jgi:hypothetical protein